MHFSCPCSSPALRLRAPPKVVASLTTYAGIAREIIGDRGTVKTPFTEGAVPRAAPYSHAATASFPLTMGLYAGDVYVMFKPKREWKTRSPAALIVSMDSALSHPGIDYNFTAPMAMRLDQEDVSVDVRAGAIQVELALDRGALARHGLNVADVRTALERGVGGVHDDDSNPELHLSPRLAVSPPIVVCMFGLLLLAAYGVRRVTGAAVAEPAS